MAETVEGSFCFTVLDGKNQLWMVKGDNPLCLYHYPKLGLYIYASTEEILKAALKKITLRLGWYKKIPIESGEILRIDSHGELQSCHFHMQPMFVPYSLTAWYSEITSESAYISDLKSLSGSFGYTAEEIDDLLEAGITPEEIEDWFYYCGEEV